MSINQLIIQYIFFKFQFKGSTKNMVPSIGIILDSTNTFGYKWFLEDCSGKVRIILPQSRWVL